MWDRLTENTHVAQWIFVTWLRKQKLGWKDTQTAVKDFSRWLKRSTVPSSAVQPGRLISWPSLANTCDSPGGSREEGERRRRERW